MARSAAAEETATNRPAPAATIGGTHASARCRTPYRFTRSIRSNASSGVVQAGCPASTPATATAAAGVRPASTAVIAPRTAPSPTSATRVSTLGAPASAQSRATASRSAGVGIG